MIRAVLVLLLIVMTSSAQAQIRGIEAETTIEELMFNAQGTRDQAFEATRDLTGCSAYFDVFATHQQAQVSPNLDAVQGLQTMMKDTAVVATLIWSQHSTDPSGDIEEMRRTAHLDESDRLSALGGTNNITFLQRYDVCSQMFLFSQFFLGTAQDEL